nr:mediator of RNA polymerase II transcription subunit 12-like [Ipomoea batatas]
MTTDDACYFVDVLHEHVDSFYPNLVGKVKDDALLTVLDSNDDLETFTFDNDASINEKDESIHDIVCGDDNDIPIDENVKSQRAKKKEKKVKIGEKVSLGARPDERPVRAQWLGSKASDRALMDASRTRVRHASVRTRYRSKARNADASGRIRPDFALYLPNEEENRTPGGRTRPPRVRCYGKSRKRKRNCGRPKDARPMPPKYNVSKPTAPKSRRKECAKKRKHDVGASSRAAEGESDLLIPGGRSLRHLSGAEIARVEELRAKGASGGYYFDLSMLEAYACREEVERMLTRPSWAHLFSWRDDTYEPVTHEFIATYTAIPSNHMWTPCMKFTLFGREHEVSLIQLGEILGFYTPEDSRTEEWRNLPSDFDSDAAAEAYWYEITNGRGGRFTGTKPNTSKVVRSPLLMMKLLLNLTFGGRNKNLHKIYRFDLFNLWSLEMNEPIQMACMVQQLFTSQTQPKCPYVWIGPVITKLCHGLGLQAELAREKSVASMQPFTEAHLGRSYAPRIGAAPRPRREEQPQEQEPVVQGGPDVPPEYAEYPPVYDWASMRAFQLQLHNQSMNAFNQRMDLHHEELMRQNEAIARQNEAYVRQEERQEQQFQAIEQLRLWMEQRFPPPSQGGDE